MRVLVADKLPDTARVRLASVGCEVWAEHDLSGDTLNDAMRDFDPHVLVVRSTVVEARHVDSGVSLGLVVRAGAGVNNVDLQACSARGVYVSNCPGKNAIAVAELTIGLLVALDRRIPDNVSDFRDGRWNKAAYSKADGLAGRTLGILGMGGIGRAVAVRAKAMGMKVVAWSRSLTAEDAEELGVERAGSPAEVAGRCHALTVHLAMAPDTIGLVDATVFGALPHHALFINTARAEVVDSAAMERALDERGLRAAVDVPPEEPAFKEGAFTHRWASHPRVYVTHHIGASTNQAQLAVASEAVRIVLRFRDTGKVDNAVNVADRTGDSVLVVRHLDRVGVLAGVLGVLREAGLNVEQMENIVFDGGEGAVARMSVGGDLSADLLDSIRALDNVLAVSASAAQR